MLIAEILQVYILHFPMQLICPVLLILESADQPLKLLS